MGSLQDIAGMIPGMDAKALSGANVDEKAMGRIEAIIQSMTPGERDNPAILNSSRKKRIAAGSGTNVQDVNQSVRRRWPAVRILNRFQAPAGSWRYREH